VRQEVKAGRTSPLIPIIAETMARVLGAVKSEQKKIGADGPRNDLGDDDESVCGVFLFSGGELGLGRH
jgi:hypothetical protein